MTAIASFTMKHSQTMTTVSYTHLVQTFRKVSGYSYASTMCIGNIRNGTSALADYTETHNKASLRRARCV